MTVKLWIYTCLIAYDSQVKVAITPKKIPLVIRGPTLRCFTFKQQEIVRGPTSSSSIFELRQDVEHQSFQ